MYNPYLFLYGSLQKDYESNLIEGVGDNLVYIGVACVKSGLYVLSSYPEFDQCLWQGRVCGKVYEVKEAERVLAELDAYGGEGFKRERASAKMEKGYLQGVWIYWQRGNVVNQGVRLKDNDYLNYLKHKKDRFK